MRCWSALSSQTSVFFQMNVFLTSVKQLSRLEFIQSRCNIPPLKKEKRNQSLLLQNKSVFFSFMVRLFFSLLQCKVLYI